jgi:hypothetical protein
VARLSDELISALNIPKLPSGVPQRLEDGLRARIDALLFQLREAKRERYIPAIETRLVRDAQQAVLTANELGLEDAEVYYATFRHLVEELGYERVEAGFAKGRDGGE